MNTTLNNIKADSIVSINVTGGSGTSRITVNEDVSLKALGLPGYEDWMADQSQANVTESVASLLQKAQGQDSASQLKEIAEKMSQIAQAKAKAESQSYDQVLRNAVTKYLVDQYGFTTVDSGSNSKVIKPQEMAFNIIPPPLGSQSNSARLSVQLQAAYGYLG